MCRKFLNMKRQILYIALMLNVAILFGCASTYKPINPTSVNYSSYDIIDGIGCSYKYDVLRSNGNKKYAKKANKKGVKLVAIKLTNYTDSTIHIGRDLNFYSGQQKISLLDPLMIKYEIKQNVPSYIPYLLLTPASIYTSNGHTEKTYPVGLVLGPGLALGNMGVAALSNQKMLKELIEYNILYKEIKKEETVYGIIGAVDIDFNPIYVRLKESSD